MHPNNNAPDETQEMFQVHRHTYTIDLMGVEQYCANHATFSLTRGAS